MITTTYDSRDPHQATEKLQPPGLACRNLSQSWSRPISIVERFTIENDGWSKNQGLYLQ